MVDDSKRDFLRELGMGGVIIGTSLAGCTGQQSDDTTKTTETTDSGGGSDSGGSDGDTTTEQKQVKLTVGTWESGARAEKWKTLLSNFAEQSDLVQSVEHKSTPYDQFQQKLKTQLGAGEAPTAFYIDEVWASDWANAGALLNLSQYIKDDEDINMDNVLDRPEEAYSFNGKQYAMPHSASGITLHYNTQMFEQAGLDPASAPTSWEDLRKACEAIAENNSNIAAPLYNDPQDPVTGIFWTSIFQKNAPVLNEDGSKCVIASEENISSLEFFAKMKKDGLITLASEVDANWYAQAIAAKKVAMINTGWWAVPYYRSNYPEMDKKIDAAHFPTPTNGERGTVLNTTGFGASANAEHPKAAYELVKYLTYGEGATFSLKEGLSTPPVKRLLESDYLNENPRTKLALEASSYASPLLFGDHTSQILNITSTEVEAAFMGRKTAKSALETAQSKINSDVL